MSLTTNKSIEKPVHGADIDTWDVNVNADWDIIDASFGGLTSINVTGVGAGTYSLSIGQYRPPNIVLSGTLGGNLVYQIPSGVGGQWSIFNNTTGAFTITIASLGGGSAILLPQTYRTQVICDGTNFMPSNTAPFNPGGSSTQVQVNSGGGTLAGSATFTFNGTNGTMGLVGSPAIFTLTGGLRLGGSASGYIGLSAPAAAASVNLVLPNGVGAAGQVLTTDGAGTLSWTGIVGGVSSFSAGSTGLTPAGATGGAITLGGTLSLGNGGTGQSSAQAAMNSLAGGVTSARFLRANGANVILDVIQASDVPPGINISGQSGTVASIAGNSLSSGQVTGGLGFTPYNATNPSGFITSAALGPYLTSATASSTYAPLGGSGASGTWSINVTGNAGGSSSSCTGNSATATVSASCSGNAASATVANSLSSSTGYTVGGLSCNASVNIIDAQTPNGPGSTGALRVRANAVSGLGYIQFTDPAASADWGNFASANGVLTWSGELRVTGNITAYYSDMRLKDVQGPILNALDKVKTLDGFYFKANALAKKMGYTDEVQIGLSAQAVEAILPEIIKPAPIDKDYKTLDYAKLVPLLIEAIKELSAEVEALKAGK